MHVEVPKSKKWKEFSGEYLMIVISILTALALEHAVQTLHHRHLAHEAAEKMDAELQANIKEVAFVLDHNTRKMRELEAVRNELLAGIRNKDSDAELMARFNREWLPRIKLSVKSPTLHREAWEAAVANQAVTWLPREELERYSNVYGSMRDMTLLFHGGGMQSIDGPRLRDTFSNVQMGTSNPQEIFRTLNQMLGAYDSVEGNLQILRKELEEASGGKAHQT